MAVFVSVGVLDKAAVASCAWSVPEARVARALRFAVGDGLLGVEEAVTVRVAVEEGVVVGDSVNVGETTAGVVGV